MICKISGTLEQRIDRQAEVAVGGITYMLSISPYTFELLSAVPRSQPITLHTIHYLEGSMAGGNMIPRLLGFMDLQDLEMCELLRKVKNFGYRRALACMAIPTEKIAHAIHQADVTVLRSLPEIGPTIAKNIITELEGKLVGFLAVPTDPSAGRSRESTLPTQLDDQVLSVLLSLGLKRTEAEMLIKTVLQADPDLREPDQLMRAVLARLGR